MDLYFDVESSGLWRDSLPPDHSSQPHLLQLAAKLCTEERTEAAIEFIVQPEGWVIEPEAEAHHGITAKRAHRVGVPLAKGLLMFQAMAEHAKNVVAHHVNFDRALIQRSLADLKAHGGWWNNRGGFRCTMEESVDRCRLPGQFGFKFPTLEEAHGIIVEGGPLIHSFNPWRSKHDARDDMEACFRIFRALQTPSA